MCIGETHPGLWVRWELRGRFRTRDARADDPNPRLSSNDTVHGSRGRAPRQHFPPTNREKRTEKRTRWVHGSRYTGSTTVICVQNETFIHKRHARFNQRRRNEIEFKCLITSSLLSPSRCPLSPWCGTSTVCSLAPVPQNFNVINFN